MRTRAAALLFCEKAPQPLSAFGVLKGIGPGKKIRRNHPAAKRFRVFDVPSPRTVGCRLSFDIIIARTCVPTGVIELTY